SACNRAPSYRKWAHPQLRRPPMTDRPPPPDPHATLDPPTGERLTLDPAVPTSGADTAPDLPTTVGRFVIREFLGAGTFGTVYRAHHPQLDREVALKVMPAAGQSPDRL